MLDVAIIGAGLAGLQSAQLLEQAGLRARVFEARERVGGRLLSKDLHGHTVDLGAQWIGPDHHRVLALARKQGLQTFYQFDAGQNLIDFDDRPRTFTGTIPNLSPLALIDMQMAIMRVDHVAKKLSATRPWDHRRAGELDRQSAQQLIDNYCHHPLARRGLELGVRAVMACEPAELSALHLLHYVKTAGGLDPLFDVRGGAQEQRMVQGCQSLALGLAGALEEPPVLGWPLRAIEQRADHVVFHGRETLRARRILLAIPSALLDKLTMQPALPVRHAQAWQREFMGSVIKCVLRYERPFWRENGFSGHALTDRSVFSMCFDDSAPDDSMYALVCFMLGDQAQRYAGRSQQARRLDVCAELGRLFGDEARRPAEYLELNWPAERYSRGCYVSLLPPGAGALGLSCRAEPVGRVHFAGTETASFWNGYMEGALQSAERASQEILEAMA